MTRRPPQRPVRMPKLEELQLLCAIAELGGVGRAAQRLHLTQPAASKRLQGLEQLVGKELFDRSPHGMTLTPAGERLYAQARLVLTQLDELMALVGELKSGREALRLAISHTAAEFLLPRALVRFEQRGGPPVEVLSANSHLVKRLVREGSVDLGVAGCLIGEQPQDLGVVELMEDEVVFAVPLAHPWSRRRRVSLQELAATPIVERDPTAHTRQVLDHALEQASLPPLEVAVEVGSTQAAKEEAHALRLPTLLSRLAVSAADRLEVVEVEGLVLRRRFCALYRIPGPMGEAEPLIEELRAVGEELGRARQAA